MRSLLIAATVTFLGIGTAHAVREPNPMTMGIGPAVGRASREAVRRAKAQGMPRSAVKRIATAGRVVAGVATRIHAEGAKAYWGVELFRSPEIVRSKGARGEFRARVDAGQAAFSGREAHDVFGGGAPPEAHAFTVKDGSAAISYPGGRNRYFARAERPLTLSGGEVPAGSWLVHSSSPSGLGRAYAITPAGKVVAARGPESAVIARAVAGTR